MTTQWIQVKLELGHKASVRAKPTADGFTHDWTVFVRGPEGSSIQHFVERVVFNLHESFPKPKRVVKEPPYQVSESGYAGFLLPIEVYFKSKEEPKKVVYQYDLYLQLHGACNHIRCEQLTFQNPTEDFRRKLIKAGGIGILSSEGGTNPVQKQSPRPSTPTSHSTSQSKVTKHVSEAIKTPKSSSVNSSSISTSCAASSTNPPLAPIKDASVKSSTKSSKASNSSSSNEQLSSTATTAKEPKSSSSKDTKDVKDSKNHLKEKSLLKRPLSPLSPISDAGPSKKRKSIVSSSSGNSKSKDSKDKKKSDKVVSKDKEKKEKKEKHKYNGDPSNISGNSINNNSSSSNNSKSLTERKNAGEKVKKESDSSSKVNKKTSKLPLSTSPSLSSSSVSGESKAAKSSKVCQPSPAHVDDAFDDGDASPSSSISFSSLHPSKGSGPLGTLMAELDEQDDDEILSPLSSDSSCLQSSVREEDALPPPPQLTHVQPPVRKPSPPPPVSKQSVPPAVNKQPSRQLTPEIVEKPKVKKEEKVTIKEEKNHSKDKKPKKSHSNKSEKRTSSSQPDPVSKKVNKIPAKELLKSGVEPLPPSGISDDYITELKELQKQIMSLRDRKHLQQIVNVIEETGQYQVTSTTFDFDLCTLDRVTVKKLQSCLATQTVV